MKYVTYYDVQTGKIYGSAACSEQEAVDNCPAGHAIYEGMADAADHYLPDGVLTALPPKPDEICYFDYQAKVWVDPRDTAYFWAEIRYRRDKLLQDCDWTQLPDVPLATKTAWAEYRQALRDVTLQPDPFNIVWPKPPA